MAQLKLTPLNFAKYFRLNSVQAIHLLILMELYPFNIKWNKHLRSIFLCIPMKFIRFRWSMTHIVTWMKIFGINVSCQQHTENLSFTYPAVYRPILCRPMQICLYLVYYCSNAYQTFSTIHQIPLIVRITINKCDFLNYLHTEGQQYCLYSGKNCNVFKNV